MDQRSLTSAQNGLAGGRPKAAHTLKAEKIRKFIIDQVAKEKGPIIKALINKAKKGDVPAATQLLDRAVGKPASDMVPANIFIPVQVIIQQHETRTENS